MPTLCLTRWAYYARAVVLSLSLTLASIQVGKASDSGPAVPDPIATIVAKVSPAVVRVIAVLPPKPEDVKPAPQVASDASGSAAAPASAATSASDHTTTSIGSGFIIDPSGFIATNKHVVVGGTSVYVMTSDGVRFPALIVGMPGKADMALLKIDADHPLPFVSFGDSDKARVGDTVIVIGSPFGFDNSVTSGIVSAVGRDIMESPFDDYIQTDAPINHGNSGGPMFNLEGQVIGMNSVIFAPGTGSVGLGFALPSNELRFVFGRLMETGEVKAGMLPIHTQPVSWMLQQALGTPDLQGALVSSVHDSGDEMLQGKIKAGDVIQTFNGEKVSDPRDLARKAAQAQIGRNAALQIFRHGASQVVNVTIQEWPEAKPIVLHDKGPRTLGLDLVSMQAETGKPDVKVDAIDPTGTAADSGIEKGDIIVQVQETTVTSPGQALDLFHAWSSKKHHFAAVLVERNKKQSWIPLAVPD